MADLKSIFGGIAKPASVGTGGGNPIERIESNEKAKPSAPSPAANPFAKAALPSTTNPFGAKKSEESPAPAATVVQSQATGDRGLGHGGNALKSNPFGLGGASVPVSEKADSDSASDASGLGDFGFDLSTLDVSQVGETRPKPTRSQFDDEIPATAPDREIPEDAAKEVIQFVELIDNVYSLWDDPELLSNVIRGIMIELKSNPQYMNLVSKDDVRLWVLAMRNNMGLAQVKKQESKAKRASGGKGKGKAVDADVLGAIDSLGINFDNL